MECRQCVLPDTYPGIEFDEHGICNICRDRPERKRQEIHNHFKNEEELISALQKYKNHERDHDVLVPISGGVDSCSSLIRIVERFGLRPLVFHNDHGWDNMEARENVEKLCQVMDLDLVIWRHDVSFMRKLFKYFNETNVSDLSACFVCGNILYLNGIELAEKFNIPLVINGYSKGQAAMMRDIKMARHLYEKMLNVIEETGDMDFYKKFYEKWALLEKQIIFQGKSDLEKEVNPGKILFIPLFIFDFYQTDKETLKKMCEARFDWRPIAYSYPARTTNCDMIWLNSVMDMKKRGYTLYHDEYSELIRAGEITREQALKDLEIIPPEGLLERLKREIDLNENPQSLSKRSIATDVFKKEDGDFHF